MHREKPDKYAILLSAGILELEHGDSWHPVHAGLRDVVIKTALTGEHANAVRKSVRQRRRIIFKDDEHGFVLRWSPCGVN